jgi:hypothetical protein
MKILLILSLLISLPLFLIAQNHLLFLDNATFYSYIDYLINSGNINIEFPLQQPYSLKILDKNDRSTPINTYFINYLNEFYGNKNTTVGLHLHNATEKSHIWRFQYRGDFNFFYHNQYISFVNRTIVDSRYKNDPYYAGDLSEANHWLYGRVNDAFLDLKLGEFNLFVGRLSRNWGPITSLGLLVSNNPYTYDQIYFSYTHNRLKLSWIFAPLEDLQGIEYQPEDSIYVDWGVANKYINGHRLDIRIRDNFHLGLTEMAIYGGPDRRFELAYANPMTFYYGVQRNDKKGMNGLWLLDVFYKPSSKISLYGQFLIDDIIVNNDPGVDDRARYPDRLGMQMSFRSGNLLLNGLNLNLTYIRIWNRTYQSLRSWENYHYRGLGLGYPHAACKEVKFKIGYWGLFPLFIENKYTVGRYGNVSLQNIFPCKHESFPVKPVKNIQTNEFSLYYLWHTRWQLFFKIYYYSDISHYQARYYKDKMTISVGFEWFINTGWNF